MQTAGSMQLVALVEDDSSGGEDNRSAGAKKEG